MVRSSRTDLADVGLEVVSSHWVGLEITCFEVIWHSGRWLPLPERSEKVLLLVGSFHLGKACHVPGL